jgi:HicA toxin of bacterial toxin-antitoxin,
VNSSQQKTLEALFKDPINGNIEWRKIESMLLAVGCQKIESFGSSVTFAKDGVRVSFHRPHPQKEALRYRVKDAREFLKLLGYSI